MASGSLLPREHGAYAQLLFPLVTGLTLGRTTATAALLAGAALAFFLAHEPLAVLMGLRGERLRHALGRRARRRLALLAAVGAGLALPGMWRAGAALWPSIALPGVAAGALLLVVARRRQKTLLGELLVVTTFSSLVLPLAEVSEASPALASSAALVWWTSLALGTLAVHTLKMLARRRPDRRWIPAFTRIIAVGVLAISLGGAVAWSGTHTGRTFLALFPPSLAAVTVLALRVHPRRLKRVGWSLVAANLLTWILLVSGS